MATDRPITELPAVYRKMAAWARDDDAKVVRDNTRALHQIVNTYGSRFHIRGRSGAPVKLSAMSNIKVFGTTPVGRVKGIPEGFWVIVEQGRGGGYLVASRSARSGGRRKGGQASLSRRFGGETGEGSGFGDLKPISTPMGPRMWAKPGPHGPIGKPWATSMQRGALIVSRVHATHRVTRLAQAFVT